MQTGRVAGDGNVRELADDVIPQPAFSTAIGAEAEGFSWCGFDDGDVVIGDPGAGDVDAEFEGAADDLSDGTRLGRDGRLHGRALGVKDLEEFPSSPKARLSFPPTPGDAGHGTHSETGRAMRRLPVFRSGCSYASMTS